EQASGCKYLSQGVRIGIVACSELFGVDACRHKQTVNSKRGGALEVGSHRISYRQYPMMLGRSAPDLLRDPHGLLVNRTMGLPGIDDRPAGRGIEIGNCACAINELVTTLDHNIRIGADHRSEEHTSELQSTMY